MHTTLLQWLLASALSLSPDRNHEAIAEAIHTVVTDQQPLFANDTSRQRTAALLIAVNFREGSLIPEIRGDKNKKGDFTSFCSMQIHLPFGAKTPEGWTGDELAEDPVKCVTVGLRMLRQSAHMCPKHPVAFYASGPGACTNTRAQKISNDRMFIAARLVKEVQWPEEHAAAEPASWGVSPSLHASRMFWSYPD